jgi:hypothetical protein
MPTTIVRSPKDPAHPFAALDKRLVEDSTLSSTIATTGDFFTKRTHFDQARPAASKT